MPVCDDTQSKSVNYPYCIMLIIYDTELKSTEYSVFNSKSYKIA